MGIVALLIVGLVFLLQQSLGGTEVSRHGDGTPGTKKSEEWGNTVSFDGISYRRNTSLRTILLLGVDQSEEDRTYLLGGGGRSDAILLLVMDPETETMRLVEVSRDSMVDVDVYNQKDEYLYSGQMQLTLQYSVGSSAARSNWLMKNKVSEILYGVPIDYTMSLTMNGIPEVVDALGGIRMTFEKDYTDIDPLFVEGTELLLDGDLAYKFIRTRDIEVTGSNDDRMERHAQVMRAIAAQLPELTTDQIDGLLEAADPYLEMDIDADTLYSMRGYALDDTLYKLPGATQAGKEHDEYYLDEEALQQMVLDLFYQAEK